MKSIQILPVGARDTIQKDDLLLISDGFRVFEARAKEIKTTDQDGVEVIYNKSKNHYFNVGLYLAGKSSAKDVQIVRMAESEAVRP